MAYRVPSALFVLVLVACEQPEPPSGECIADPDDTRLYPLQTGAWWRHRVTNPNTGVDECPDKVVFVDAYEPIPLRPEITAYRVVRRSSQEVGVRWQEVRGDDIVRHVDEWFDLAMQRTLITYYCPWQVRVSARDTPSWMDQPLQADVYATTPEDWPECEAIEIDRDTCMPVGNYDTNACAVLTSAHVSTWTSVETDDSVSVPAGEFSDLRAWAIQDDGGTSDTYTWARGLGKLSETRGGTEREALVDCCLPSMGCTREAPEEIDADCP